MKSRLEVEDKHILIRLKAGDEYALQELITLYKRPLAHSMIRMVKSREDVEELLQELYLRVWKNREVIDVDKPIISFLFIIARNLVYDFLRKSAREKKLVVDYFLNLVDSYSHIEEGIFDKETKDVLDQAIMHLPEQRRRVFKLCKLEGMSYEEVGKLLSISIPTVNSHITNANHSIKSFLLKRPDLVSILFVALLFSDLK